MIWREIKFLLALWKTNLLGEMEYRAVFLTQVVGMILNDAMYFVFWVLFFDRFKVVSGWQLDDMVLLFGLVALGFGSAAFFFGNGFRLSDIITRGNLDYYLALPRPVLLHALASRSISSGIGDMTYGLLSFFVARRFTLETFGLFLLAAFMSMLIFLSFLVLVHSLSFWLGNSQLLSIQAVNAVVTFAIYPISLFEGPAKFILFTLLPAAFMGAIPVELVRSFTWGRLFELVAAALAIFLLAVFVFYRGLKRYESGSAIQVQL